MNNIINLTEITEQFLFEGEFLKAIPYGLGHINDTYALSYMKNEKVHRYILQRINTNVFRTPEALMKNIENVTSHLRKKILTAGGNPDRETLNLIKTVDNQFFHKNSAGYYWRAYDFIEGAQTYQIVENANHLYNAGRAIGNFENHLADFPVSRLYETIPDFHNTKKRFINFLEALSMDTKGRAKEIQPEIDFVLNRKNDTAIIVDLISEGKLPLRVTHNDTKFNNIMIDDLTGEGICVIDLDTIMPGVALYDFGDAIRSGTNTADEDESNLEKVCMNITLFENFTRGFLYATKNFLTELELEYLPFSAKLITFENGIRFLTDYLNGDTYFKIHREKHNLDRARTQFKMVEDMEEKLEEMKFIVQKYSK